MSGLVQSVSARDGAWRRIILDSPRGNLLSLELVRALGAAIHALESEPGIKWLTVEGSGGEFSYGARIQEHVPGLMGTVLPETHRVFKRLLAFPAPTAALVEGRCLGGGFELALACDDIIATETAVFGLPEIRIAAFPPAAAALLPLRVGASRATRAIVTGQTQTAQVLARCRACVGGGTSREPARGSGGLVRRAPLAALGGGAVARGGGGATHRAGDGRSRARYC